MFRVKQISRGQFIGRGLAALIGAAPIVRGLSGMTLPALDDAPDYLPNGYAEKTTEQIIKDLQSA